MKPQQPDIEYCKKNADFVNGLLEKRGGWQKGDWLWDDVAADSWLVQNSSGKFHESDIWLPSVDDVLGMLRAIGKTVQMTMWPDKTVAYADCLSGNGATPLIALLELLRSV